MTFLLKTIKHRLLFAHCLHTYSFVQPMIDCVLTSFSAHPRKLIWWSVLIDNDQSMYSRPNNGSRLRGGSILFSTINETAITAFYYCRRDRDIRYQQSTGPVGVDQRDHIERQFIEEKSVDRNMAIVSYTICNAASDLKDLPNFAEQ